MLYLIAVAVSACFCVVSKVKNWYDTFCSFCIIGTIAMLLSVIFVGVGSSTYPDMQADRAKIESLKSNITTIREARYTTKTVKNALVSGSLDNVQQSTNLSTYIADYAKELAEYNRKITYYKIARKSWFYRWFSYTVFIDKRLDDLEVIN